MRQGKGWLMVWVAVILGLGLWAPGALAFWPPCQQVTAWKEGTYPNQTVHYKVYDPKKGAYVEESTGPGEFYDLYFPHGMVFWGAKVSSRGALYCRVYDPGRSSWQGDVWIADDYFVGIPEGSEGVVAWLASAGPGATKCVLRTYDPGPGVWKGGELFSNYPEPVYLITHDGVVAWALRNFFTPPYSAHILFAVYDPSRGEWRTGEAEIGMQQGDPWPSLGIDQATVVFGDYRFGYDPTSGGWISGFNTPPLSRFVAQPTAGKAPLWVWFTDMSIGGTVWSRSWTFGDGGSSTDRSPSHTYGNKGKFTVTQQVVAPSVTNSSSQDIRVWAASPTPGVDLLLLQ